MLVSACNIVGITAKQNRQTKNTVRYKLAKGKCLLLTKQNVPHASWYEKRGASSWKAVETEASSSGNTSEIAVIVSWALCGRLGGVCFVFERRRTRECTGVTIPCLMKTTGPKLAY